jgi:hypothetical protein
VRSFAVSFTRCAERPVEGPGETLVRRFVYGACRTADERGPAPARTPPCTPGVQDGGSGPGAEPGVDQMRGRWTLWKPIPPDVRSGAPYGVPEAVLPPRVPRVDPMADSSRHVRSGLDIWWDRGSRRTGATLADDGSAGHGVAEGSVASTGRTDEQEARDSAPPVRHGRWERTASAGRAHGGWADMTDRWCGCRALMGSRCVPSAMEVCRHAGAA